MRLIVRRKRLGDRMIAAVGLLVAAAVAVLLGFAVLVAKRVDEASAARETELARAHLAKLSAEMRNDLAQFARWDESLELINDRNGREWIHHQFGVRLHRLSGHDMSFILGGDGQPVYASVAGDLVSPDAYRRVQSAVDSYAGRVRRAHVRSAISDSTLGLMGEFDPPSEPQFIVAFLRIEGRPALVGVTTIAPTLRRSSQRQTEPFVAASISFLDEDMLAQMSREIVVDGVMLVENQQGSRLLADAVGVRVPLSEGEAQSWLVWQSSAPGAAMLWRLSPALVALMALLGVATLLVLVYLRRTTERLNQSERRATELAYRDRLTGLANRVQMMQTLAEWLADLPRDRRLALALIDIDDFKSINDTLGHATGDEVLFAIGERLTTVAGEQGVAVRFGADEFALLAPVGAGEGEVLAVCRHIADAMRNPVMAGGQFLAVGVTIGVAVAPDDATEAEQLLRRADIALSRAKADCRGNYRLFDPRHEEALHRRSAIERDLQHAIANDELSVKFQPLFAADGERMVGVEALVRWNHPERGIVPPSEFIPVAEHTGLVVKIDEWMLRRACEYASQWPGLSLAVNMSASNFRQGKVAERLSRVLVETGFDPRRLEIEITESMLLGANSEVLGELSELRRLGIRIALDDFGTGYSSLGYLRRFPVDKLKIDKSFVQNLGITEDAAAIVECVTRLGRALGLAVTAEGVETGEQHRFVRAVGCHQVQGYLFSPPVDAEKIDAMLRPEQPARPHGVMRRLATA
ncbi:MAG: EAL domain-containing protein [Bradyrhizobiaceae bacterium]|nr:EAL domain-containing protein [Bradyrhizobiaceae bacterium]